MAYAAFSGWEPLAGKGVPFLISGWRVFRIPVDPVRTLTAIVWVAGIAAQE